MLSLVNSSVRHLSFNLSCLTDLELYDQPLTIEVDIPKSCPPDRVLVTDGQSKNLAFRTVKDNDQIRLRFEVAPRTAEYTITLSLDRAKVGVGEAV
jgi:hypothetical protein